MKLLAEAIVGTVVGVAGCCMWTVLGVAAAFVALAILGVLLIALPIALLCASVLVAMGRVKL